jgi:hypothetical protein
MVEEPIHNSRIRRQFTECETWRRRVLDYVGETRPDVVVIGSSGAYEFSDLQWERGTISVLERLRQSGAPVIIVAPTPDAPFELGPCHDLYAGLLPECTGELAAIRWSRVESALERAVSQVSGTALINFNDLLCPDGYCRAVVDGVATYRDPGHLNAAYVEMVSDLVRERIDARLVLSAPSSTQEHGRTP